jgi:hypothetical protein
MRSQMDTPGTPDPFWDGYAYHRTVRLRSGAQHRVEPVQDAGEAVKRAAGGTAAQAQARHALFYCDREEFPTDRLELISLFWNSSCRVRTLIVCTLPGSQITCSGCTGSTGTLTCSVVMGSEFILLQIALDTVQPLWVFGNFIEVPCANPSRYIGYQQRALRDYSVTQQQHTRMAARNRQSASLAGSTSTASLLAQ